MFNDDSESGSTLPIANEAIAMDITPLTNGSMALTWKPVENSQEYRVYSDMGCGYEVYIYKASTDQPAFIDEKLRSGATYSYRLVQVAAATRQEVVLGQISAHTFAKEKLTSATVANNQIDVSPVSIMAAPTALPPDAVLLGLISDNNFTDEFNTLTIVGEIRNDSNVTVGQTDITVTFYNAAGATIGTTNGKTMIKNLSPGESSPFIISLSHPPGLASHSLRAVARPVPAKQPAQLSVTEIRRFEDNAGFFHVKGVIKNNGATVAKRVIVASVIYNRDNNVINVGFTYSAPPTLKPGESADYDIIFAYYPRYATQTVIPFEE
jgi:hypothetical protein